MNVGEKESVENMKHQIHNRHQTRKVEHRQKQMDVKNIFWSNRF